ncbi:Rha family transcriptional regulator [Pseudomonas sp. SIMBA_067]|uniref:Rha family transcriptional regulator n=1 Tax=Pseudomonas sp. SIMBA_067 TaxID=3085807 RepID=UPI00397B0AB6
MSWASCNAGCPDRLLITSSREIAKLTGKRHDHVMTDIKRMLRDIERHAPDFLGTYQTDRGNTYRCFDLPRRETDVLLTGYNMVLRAKVIDRWRDWKARSPTCSSCLYGPCTAWASVTRVLAGTQMRSQPHS